MRLFHAQILDEVVNATTLASASNAWNLLLARAESLRFTFVVDQVGGTSPTLSSNLLGTLGYDSGELAEVAAFLLVNAPLSSGINVIAASYIATDPTNPPPRYLSFGVGVGGTNPTARVRVWVCGRGPQLLETVPSDASFAAQYDCAKRLDDEDRLASRRKVAKAGMSYFSPPEMFLPSLKWER